MACSFIGGGNWNTQRKPPTCGKSHNVVSSIPCLSGVRTHNVDGIKIYILEQSPLSQYCPLPHCEHCGPETYGNCPITLPL